MQIESHIDSGETKSNAVSLVADTGAASAASIWSWRRIVKSVDRHDWLAYLIPGFRGGGRLADIDFEALEALEAEFLRPDALSWRECVRRAKDRAEARGLRLPHERTLWRRIKRKYNRAAIAVLRDQNL